MSRRGHPPILNDVKKREVLAILSTGAPRCTAAYYVGCSVRSIYNTALRDPEFADELHKRETIQEIAHLHNVNRAGNDTRLWRASAWYLERRHPDRYGVRTPESATPEQVKTFISRVTEMLVEEVPVAKFRKRILARLNDFLDDSEENCKRRYEQGKYSYSKKRKFSKKTDIDFEQNDEKAQNHRAAPAESIPPPANFPGNTAFQPRLTFDDEQFS